MEFYKSMDYFFITRMVSDWMRYAGPKARKEFSDQVKEHVWDARERTENSFERGYVFNFAADYSDEIPIHPQITLKGMEYLANNSFMKKAAEALKMVGDFI